MGAQTALKAPLEENILEIGEGGAGQAGEERTVFQAEGTEPVKTQRWQRAWHAPEQLKAGRQWGACLQCLRPTTRPFLTSVLSTNRGQVLGMWQELQEEGAMGTNGSTSPAYFIEEAYVMKPRQRLQEVLRWG